MKLRLVLDYSLGEGRLATYRSGLQEGSALAGRCDGCGRVTLPPDPACPCGSRSYAQLPLTGLATVVWRTSGSDGVVALVQFDGADTLSLARLKGFGTETRGRVAPDPDCGLVLVPEISE